MCRVSYRRRSEATYPIANHKVGISLSSLAGRKGPGGCPVKHANAKTQSGAGGIFCRQKREAPGGAVLLGATERTIGCCMANGTESSIEMKTRKGLHLHSTCWAAAQTIRHLHVDHRLARRRRFPPSESERGAHAMPACGKVFDRIVRPPPVQAIASGGNRAAVAVHGDGCGCIGESSHTTPAHGRRRAAVGAAASEGVWRDNAVEQEAGCAEPERPSKQETKASRARTACQRTRAEGGSPFRGRSRGCDHSS
jgi:hypothetical protein